MNENNFKIYVRSKYVFMSSGKDKFLRKQKVVVKKLCESIYTTSSTLIRSLNILNVNSASTNSYVNVLRVPGNDYITGWGNQYRGSSRSCMAILGCCDHSIPVNTDF